MNFNLIIIIISSILFVFNIYTFFAQADTGSLFQALLWLFVIYQNIKIYFANKD